MREVQSSDPVVLWTQMTMICTCKRMMEEERAVPGNGQDTHYL